MTYHNERRHPPSDLLVEDERKAEGATSVGSHSADYRGVEKLRKR